MNEQPTSNSASQTISANIKSPAITPEIMAKVKIPRKFEIFIEEFDEEHEPGIWKPVRADPKLGGSGGNPVIVINSQQDMQEKIKFYRDIGQRFKIIREVDPPSPEQILEMAREQGIIVAEPKNEMPNVDNSNVVAHVSAPVQNVPSTDCIIQNTKYDQQKPRIVTIGDIQIKYENGKVYQKQWLKLTPQESSNIRVVNTQTNKVVSMTGKHFEAKRWVLVEETHADSDSIEEIFS